MKHQTALRGMTIALLLIISAILPAALPTAQAANPYAKTTFYYTDAYDYDNIGDVGLPELSLDAPTNDTDLYYPYEYLKPLPTVFQLIKTLRNNETIENTDDLSVLGQSLLLYFALEVGIDELGGLGEFSDLGDLSDLGELEGLLEDMLLLMPHPLRLSQTYTYEGDESFKIQGDLTYQLYFESKTLVKKNDQITVGLYKINSFGLPTKIKDTTLDLNTPTLGGVYEQSVTLTNVDTTIYPDDILLLSAEIQPGNKTLSNMLTGERITNLANRAVIGLANLIINNQNRSDLLAEIASYIEEFDLTGDNSTLSTNLTTQLIGSAIDLIKSNRFIYGSTTHPASITIPTSIPGYDEQIQYYLNTNNALTPTIPTTDTKSTTEITESAQSWTTTINPERNKILTNATANLFFTYTKLIPKTVEISAQLYDETTLIAEDSQELRSKLLPSQQLVSFSFNTQDYELAKDHSLSLTIALTNGSDPGRLSSVKLDYDSTTSPSSLLTSYQETDNIKITSIIAEPTDTEIVPNDSITYTITIESLYSDSISISTPIQQQNGDSWTLNSNPETLTISANGNETFNITLKHNDNTKENYGENIAFSIIASGNTGIDKTSATAEVTTDAIEYNIDIIAYTNETQQAKKGEQAIYRVKIKNSNTGAIDDDDSYSIDVTSQNNWNLTYDTNIDSLTRLDTQELIIAVDIPQETDKKSDQISFTITSDGNSETSKTLLFNLSVTSDSIQEGIYELFKDIADDLGLTETFGDDAPLILISILLLIVFFFLIVILLLLKQKTFTVHLADAIQDIKAKQKATYNVDIENTTKQSRTFSIKTLPKQPKWSAEAKPKTLKIDGHQAETSVITIAPPKDAANEDWAEVVISVNEQNKKNTKQLSTLTTIDDNKAKPKKQTNTEQHQQPPLPVKEETPEEPETNTLLKLTNIYSWPEEFYENERVVTSIRCENHGDDDAEDVDIILYINGKQKNKVTLDIPAGGYADIKLPWIAAKGKNKLYIRAKEKKQ